MEHSEPDQQQPLLPAAAAATLSSEEVELILAHEPVGLHRYCGLIAWESRLLWLLSGSSIVVAICNYMLSFVTLTFSGHLSAVDLAAASIAMVGAQGLAYGIMLGMASAVQTVCGQAYGAKQFGSMGIVLQRAIILHLGVAVLLCFVYIFFGEILEAVGQEAAIAGRGQTFARGMIPQLFAFSISCPMQRFLQAQNIVNPLACMSFSVFLLHILLSWLVVYVLGYGLLGAALTLSLSWWILAFLQGIYILLSPSCKKTWTGFAIGAAFRGLWPYAKLTFASAVMLCLEIWYFQGLIFISGFLPNPTIALDSLSICLNYWTWDIEFMLGLSAAASVRVSNELGADHPTVARFSAVVVHLSSILLSILFSAIVLIFRVGLSKLFTSDEEVILAVSDLTPLLAISVLLNGIQPILSGVAIGTGRQAIVAYVNLAAYYIIGLPIGCVLGFVTYLEAAGIWWGMITGVVLQTVTLIIITARTNWTAEAEKAADRLKKTANAAPREQIDGSSAEALPTSSLLC
ncbi:protein DETOXIFICATION 41-like [Diospyros lotus]|uniref:protein DETOXIFICATION 41-like n=1 Tax=Diospyros lotus TaxID=55363 RepID=UPI00225B1F6A|nr:protein DETOXIFICATION 41-like [Diospyros lotus]